MKTDPARNRTPIMQWLVLLCGTLSMLLVLAVSGGCGKSDEPKTAEPTLVSYDNLQTAYGVAMKRARMYELFVPRAEKEKYAGMAALYKALARAERAHADAHASLMQKLSIVPGEVTYDSTVVGTTMQTLKMAVSSEELELSSMYPNLGRTAEAENFAEGAAQFAMLQASEDRHLELLKDAQNKLGKVDRTYFVCPGCGYILTSGETAECPVCKRQKTTFEKI